MVYRGLNYILDDFFPERAMALQVLQVRLCWNEPSSVKISVFCTDQLCLADQLEAEEETCGANPREPGAQETLDVFISPVTIIKEQIRLGIVARVLWRVENGKVEVGNNAAHSDNEGQNVTIGVTPRDIGQLLNGTTLLLPAVAEAEMKEDDQEPGLENDGSDHGHKPIEDNSGTNKDRNQGEARASCDNRECGDGNTTRVGVTDLLVGPTVTSQGQKDTGGDVEVRVDGGEDRCENNGVHVIGGSVDTSLGKDNGKRCLGCSPGRVQELFVVVLDDGAEQENRNDVEERNADQDSVHSLGYMLVRVAGLGSGNTSHLRTTIGVCDSNKSGDKSLEASFEGGTLNVPGIHAVLLATNDTRVDQDTTDDEHEDSEDFQDGEPVLDFTICFDTSDIDADHDDNDD